jgi:hypothetical protein
MKKTFFFFFALLASSAASATVTVTPITVDYSAKKVTFKVMWSGSAYNNRVWVWIDLCPVSDVTPSTFQTAVISACSATSGSVDAASLNGRGFFVTTNPSTVTATLSNASDKFNWCAYGSDYPPNAASYNNGTYTLKGTKPFVINGAAVDAKTYAGVINSLTDATGCPGGVGRDVVHNGGVCVPRLTAVGTYCRDLVADDARSVPCASSTGGSFELKNSYSAIATWPQRLNHCPDGWRIVDAKQGRCACNGGYAAHGLVYDRSDRDGYCGNASGNAFFTSTVNQSWASCTQIPPTCGVGVDHSWAGWDSSADWIWCAR